MKTSHHPSGRRAALRPMPRRRAASLTLLAAAMASLGAQAQQGGTPWLDAVTVIGSRTESSVLASQATVSVVERAQIERRAPASVAELLRDIPGVQVADSSAPGMLRLRIRGESSRRVTILVDGQEITDHSTFGTPILVDPSNIERIEVLRGPASVLHGAKAIGGVINIVTRGGAAKPLQVDLGASHFSGSEGWQAWAAVSGRSGAVDYRLSGGADAHGDRRVARGPYSEGARLDRTSYDNDNVSAHLGWRFGDTGKHYLALKADQHRLSTESWTDPASLSETTRSFVIDLPKRDLRKLGLYYDAADLSPVVAKVHLDLYHQSVERLFLNEVVTAPGMFPGTITVASTSDDRNDNWGGTLQLDLRLHPEHYTIVGLQHLTDDLRTAKTSRRSSTVPMVPGSFSESLDEASIRTSSAFAQDEWFLGEAFKLSAGARYYHTRTSLDHTSDPLRADYAGRSDGRVVGAAGLSYSGLKDTTLRLHYGEGYITPTLLQLFTDTTPAGQMLYANPALRPETSRNLEFGLRHQRGALALDATAFYTRAKDYITTVACNASPVPCPSHGRLPVRTIHVNANQARSFGLELEAQARLPAAAVQLTPYVSAAWMRRELEFGDFATYHSDTPALAGRIGLRGEGRIAQRKLWGDLFVRAASATRQQEAAGVEPSRLPGYATLNLGLGGAFGDADRVQYALALNNLLDKSYRSSFSEIPATGRSLELTLRTSF